MKKNAFTLIELAIVLTIVGLIIGGSFKLLKNSRERAYISEAKEDVKSAVDAIVGNTILNDNTLPNSGFFKNNLSPIKPPKSPLFYTYENNLTQVNICGVTSTALTLETSESNISDVAFIVVAESANRNMQTARSGDRVKIYTPSTKVDDNTTPINLVQEYDDVVEWMTLQELHKELRCNEKPFRFLNERLPNAEANKTYSATLYVENNISNVTMKCIPPLDDHNITAPSISNPNAPFKFSGNDVNASGTALFDCNASEVGTGRWVTKQYVITIDP